MANSRLERIGSIYTRVTGLLQSGAVKPEDTPLWYKIYQAFPPKYAPRFDRPTPNTEVKNIFYAEDVVRARFHKAHPKHTGVINLNDSQHKTNTQVCIEKCEQLKGTMEEEAVFKEVVQHIEANREKTNWKTSTIEQPSLASSFKKAQPKIINMKEVLES